MKTLEKVKFIKFTIIIKSNVLLIISLNLCQKLPLCYVWKDIPSAQSRSRFFFLYFHCRYDMLWRNRVIVVLNYPDQYYTNDAFPFFQIIFASLNDGSLKVGLSSISLSWKIFLLIDVRKNFKNCSFMYDRLHKYLCSNPQSIIINNGI